MTTEDEPKEEGPRSFARFIEQVADGSAHAELSAELHRLIQTLIEEAGARNDAVAGMLTLKLALKVEPNGVAQIGYKVDLKEPDKRRATGIMWVTAGGNLVPSNPRQQLLPLREVTVAEHRVRELASEGGAE